MAKAPICFLLREFKSNLNSGQNSMHVPHEISEAREISFNTRFD